MLDEYGTEITERLPHQREVLSRLLEDADLIRNDRHSGVRKEWLEDREIRDMLEGMAEELTRLKNRVESLENEDGGPGTPLGECVAPMEVGYLETGSYPLQSWMRDQADQLERLARRIGRLDGRGAPEDGWQGYRAQIEDHSLRCSYTYPWSRAERQDERDGRIRMLLMTLIQLMRILDGRLRGMDGGFEPDEED